MRKMKRGMRVFLIVVASLICLLLTIKLANFIIFESKSDFTVDDIRKAADKIYKDNMGFSSIVSVYYSDAKLKFKATHYYDEVISKMSGDQFVINTTGGDSIFAQHSKPAEIVASLECIMYFEGKNLPGKLIGVANAQTSGGMDNYRSNTTFVSIEDYEVLLTRVDITGLSRRAAARKLAAAWIEQTGYVKR